jgi:hypothetical protein
VVKFLASKNDEARKRLASIKDKVTIFIFLIYLNNLYQQEQSNGLHYACCNEHLEVLKYLIEERKFPINYKDKVMITIQYPFQFILNAIISYSGDNYQSILLVNGFL